MSNENDTAVLIQSLRNPGSYDHEVDSIQVLETHISWVVLTGPFVYKIKKPVDLGFLNFTSLDERKRCCEEEVRINRRLAADLYLGVVAIGGSPSQPILNAKEKPFEYAVKMKQFPQSARLDRVIERGELSAEHLDELAETFATFHDEVDVAECDSPLGHPDAVIKMIDTCFEALDRLLAGTEDHQRVLELRDWFRETQPSLYPWLTQRKQERFIRECHGDAHLENLALLDGRIVAFDAIEFSEKLRWIDVISDIANPAMDLRRHGRADLASHFINRYLERTGDYAGCQLLPVYVFYRAVVRAEVAAYQIAKDDDALARCRAYLRLAQAVPNHASPRLIVMHGVSGSGKSTVSDGLLSDLNAIRIRTDIERKRLFNLSPKESSPNAIKQAIYGTKASRQVYDRLLALAEPLLRSGQSVILDGTYLHAVQRAEAREVSRRCGVPMAIVSCRAGTATLKDRLQARAKEGQDPSEANVSVLEAQLKSLEPPRADEADGLIELSTDQPLQIETIADRLKMITS